MWVQRRGEASQDGAGDMYECAVQVKRYSAPLSDASVKDFCEKVGLRAKRLIFIAPGGFGKSARCSPLMPSSPHPSPA